MVFMFMHVFFVCFFWMFLRRSVHWASHIQGASIFSLKFADDKYQQTRHRHGSRVQWPYQVPIVQDFFSRVADHTLPPGTWNIEDMPLKFATVATNIHTGASLCSRWFHSRISQPSASELMDNSLWCVSGSVRRSVLHRSQSKIL